MLKKYTKIRKIIKPHVASTVCVLKNAQKQGKNILFEGAQGWFLDIDFGTPCRIRTGDSLAENQMS